ncbi:hypothetical protein E2C01_083620 [Portunus trituberculatus]|uniref:Uncharacterized protein n=1 Tax=Portunus trituberculatus TaxID=210409 RepID=A0A5B7ISY2_PORTR|nr:hypothetical protein [Portunus trituberculatus]
MRPWGAPRPSQEGGEELDASLTVAGNGPYYIVIITSNLSELRHDTSPFPQTRI